MVEVVDLETLVTRIKDGTRLRHERCTFVD